MVLHETLRMYTSLDRFVFEPVGVSGASMEVDRVSQKIAAVDKPRTSDSTVRDICGIIGIIRLLGGPYLIIVTKRKKVGRVYGADVWKATETEVIPFARHTRHLTEAEDTEERMYLSMLNSVLGSDAFYYSYSYDLTHSMQRIHGSDERFKQASISDRADHRFYWNRHLQDDFSSIPELKNFVLPVMHGFVSINPCAIKNKPFDFIIITRRSCLRQGTRFNARGIDEFGNVANFAETEQIVHHNGVYTSYVQIRGSIPLFWTQLPNIKYKPSVRVDSQADHVTACRAHLSEVVTYYGPTVLINLIDQKGSELALGQAFANTLKTVNHQQARYVAFDFHHECRKMRWDKLSLLMDQIASDFDKQGYFQLDRNGTVLSRQTGTFRTNCIDCLDRTNVVQSMIAHKTLAQQLIGLEITSPGDVLDRQTDFEFRFKNVWADNADAVSVHYSGTGALKTDFTRTGKRTKMGALQDGYNSAIRYYKNNFADGWRQDAINLFLGRHIVRTKDGARTGSAYVVRNSRFRALPMILLVGLSMFVLSLLVPTPEGSLKLAYVAFWAVALLLTWRTVLYYGTDFVDMPRLAVHPSRHSAGK
eukprot:Opistho-2@4976